MIDIEKMAREAGLTDKHSGLWMVEYGYCKDEITAFAQAVAKRCLEAPLPAINTYEHGNPCAEHYRAGIEHMKAAIRAEFGLKETP